MRGPPAPRGQPRPAQAVRLLDGLIEVAPTEATLYVERAAAHAAAAFHSRARDDAHTALYLDGALAAAHLAKGQVGGWRCEGGGKGGGGQGAGGGGVERGCALSASWY